MNVGLVLGIVLTVVEGLYNVNQLIEEHKNADK